MITIPSRIKKEVYEMGGKFQVVSKYIKTPYFDTEEEAANDHDAKLKIYRQMIK